MYSEHPDYAIFRAARTSMWRTMSEKTHLRKEIILGAKPEQSDAVQKFIEAVIICCDNKGYNAVNLDFLLADIVKEFAKQCSLTIGRGSSVRDAVRKRRKESAVQDQRLLVSEISPKFLTTKIGRKTEEMKWLTIMEWLHESLGSEERIEAFISRINKIMLNALEDLVEERQKQSKSSISEVLSESSGLQNKSVITLSGDKPDCHSMDSNHCTAPTESIRSPSSIVVSDKEKQGSDRSRQSQDHPMQPAQVQVTVPSQEDTHSPGQADRISSSLSLPPTSSGQDIIAHAPPFHIRPKEVLNVINKKFTLTVDQMMDGKPWRKTKVVLDLSVMYLRRLIDSCAAGVALPTTADDDSVKTLCFRCAGTPQTNATKWIFLASQMKEWRGFVHVREIRVELEIPNLNDFKKQLEAFAVSVLTPSDPSGTLQVDQNAAPVNVPGQSVGRNAAKVEEPAENKKHEVTNPRNIQEDPAPAQKLAHAQNIQQIHAPVQADQSPETSEDKEPIEDSSNGLPSEPKYDAGNVLDDQHKEAQADTAAPDAMKASDEATKHDRHVVQDVERRVLEEGEPKTSDVALPRTGMHLQNEASQALDLPLKTASSTQLENTDNAPSSSSDKTSAPALSSKASSLKEAQKESYSSSAPLPGVIPPLKRGPGRPRKHPIQDDTQPSTSPAAKRSKSLRSTAGQSSAAPSSRPSSASPELTGQQKADIRDLVASDSKMLVTGKRTAGKIASQLGLGDDESTNRKIQVVLKDLAKERKEFHKQTASALSRPRI